MNQLLHYIPFRIALLFSGLLLLCFTVTHAQTTTVTGAIIDGATKQPLSFASIVFVGTTTDERGAYALTATGNFTKVAVSFIGYKTITKAITPGITPELPISLESDS